MYNDLVICTLSHVIDIVHITSLPSTEIERAPRATSLHWKPQVQGDHIILAWLVELAIILYCIFFFISSQFMRNNIFIWELLIS